MECIKLPSVSFSTDKMANKDLFIVQGEASESDEEDYMSPVHRGNMNTQELVASIAGEDASSEDDLNITISAFASRIEEANASQNPKYGSLFHKKLLDSNWKAREGIKYFVRSTYFSAKDQINEVNQRLLTTQVEAQETLKLLRNSQAAVRSIDLSLSSLISQDYVPETNVVVIT